METTGSGAYKVLSWYAAVPGEKCHRCKATALRALVLLATNGVGVSERRSYCEACADAVAAAAEK
jgi:hypothetical protein